MTRTQWHDYNWQYIHESPQDPALHMALDQVITDEVSAGIRPPTLRMWEWSKSAVIIGRFQSLKNEVDPIGAATHGIQVVRRISGGGAMFLEPGNGITYSISAPLSLIRGMSFQESYKLLDSWVVTSLIKLGINAWYQPLNDISSQAGKIGGAAQARRGKAVLHHTMLAYDMDADKMLEVLRISKEKLSDKGTSSAKKRVDPLRSQTGLSRDHIINALVSEFAQLTMLTPAAIGDETLEKAHALVKERFHTEAWTGLVP
ncbi:lipoate--protein ligase family protein [Paenalcaligenes niemegkensis]|uniref:lipoate--protein ligase family protein n=1 Tax=Paenalcaligenes niemegkensis TaxID=2895469 RepID=UPI001EE7C654|nr:biotin/lipoate A/B protein ligase family protein [Paenalcaligenes niemegkensis]MCQ9616784.1 lipoate--protein ligase family protein [Paenalcaligenes niemegkensis]